MPGSAPYTGPLALPLPKPVRCAPRPGSPLRPRTPAAPWPRTELATSTPTTGADALWSSAKCFFKSGAPIC